MFKVSSQSGLGEIHYNSVTRKGIMKEILFLITLFFLIIFSFYMLSHGNFEAKDTLQITPTLADNCSNVVINDNTLTKPNEVNKILNFLDSAKLYEKKEFKILINQEIYNKAKVLIRKSQLADLKNVKLSKNDKEIRIWNIDTLYSSITKGYIFSFIDGQWKAIYIVDADKHHHFKKKYFEEPKSGWEEWNNFINNELSPEKIENSNSRLGGNDGMVMVIEVKFNQKYAKNIFYIPGLNENLVDNLLKKIKAEFYNDRIKWTES